MSKINEKTNPSMVRSLEEEVIYYRGQIREAEEIITLKMHPGWNRLKQNVQSELEKTESALDKFQTLTERELVLGMQERKDFRWMVNVIEKVEEGLPRLHQALAEAEKQLAERKAKSGTGQSPI